MLKYTRCTASSEPIESSPPFRMWCTVSVCLLRAQHLPCLPGSHQQARGSAFAPHSLVLRHLSTTSFANVGRCAVLMMALIVPGLFIWSVGTADVSDVPGRACANT